MFYPNEFGNVIPAAGGFGQDGGLDFVRQLRSAGEYPKVLGGFAADEGVGVVGSQQQDTIVGVEGAEEGDSEDSRSLRQFGLAESQRLFAVFEAGVANLDFPVLLQGIKRLAVGQAAFELVVETGDFVPGTQVLIQFERSCDRRIIYFLRRAAKQRKKTHNNS